MLLDDRCVGAHEIAYALWVGPVVAPLCVTHTCDNPPCFNPEHLLLGTHTENIRRLWALGRNDERSGPENGRAVLTWDTVRQIRDLHGDGITGAELTRRFPVGQSQISRIVRHKQWIES